MRNRLSLFIVLIIMAIAFSAPAFVFISNIGKNNFKKEIFENGVETVATVDSSSYGSSLTINDVEYYSIEYWFYDDNGNVHKGETGENYTYYDIQLMIQQRLIAIKYDPNTFKSVEMTYYDSGNISETANTLFIAVFGVVALALWVTVGFFIFKFVKIRILQSKGKTVNAMVTQVKGGVTVNHVHMFKVFYCYQDNMITKEGHSGYEYTHSQARAFENMKNIQILVYKNMSKIKTNPNEIIYEQSFENADSFDKNTSQKKFTHCQYCNSTVLEDETKCPNCGAQMNK